MQLAEAAARRMAMPADPADKARGPEPAIAFARLSGTIRQSIKLEMRLTAPPNAPRRRTPAPKAEPKRPPPPPPPPAPEEYEEPPRTEWPFLKEYAATQPAETPRVEPVPDAPVHDAPVPDAPVPASVSDGKTTPRAFRPPAAASNFPPSPPAPAKPDWIPPPPQRRATDPPRPTGPNWARLFER